MSEVPVVSAEEFAEVLAERRLPRVHHRGPGLDRVGVRQAVDRAGWRFVPLAATPDRAAFHDAIADALDLPDHYGRNLDALNDALRDLGVRTVLWWDDWTGLAAAQPRWFGRAVAVLDRDRARDHARGAALEVLLA